MNNMKVMVIRYLPLGIQADIADQVIGAKIRDLLTMPGSLAVFVLQPEIELRIKDWHYLQRTLRTFFGEPVDVIYI
uniref:Uncharacterized protein n=1 Tax=viral metagenome TaxID=1070528 RepID=A0A6H1ZUW0_9ZZZZ